jgi:O-antigen ligase
MTNVFHPPKKLSEYGTALRAMAPAVLGGLAFAFQGAKTPIAFAAWSIFSFLLLGFIVRWRFPGGTHEEIAVLGAMAVIALLQAFSLDPSNSLCWTSQALVYAVIWPILRRAAAASPQPAGFKELVRTMAIITLVITGIQRWTHANTCGWIPTNANFNAVWMAALAIALSADWLCRAGDNRKRSVWDLMMSVALSLLVILVESRSGLVALLTGYAALWFTNEQRLSRRAIGILAIVITMAGTSGWLENRLGLSALEGWRPDRLRFWSVALRGISDHPFTGYGLGNFELAYQKHAFPVEEDAVRFGRTTEFAHNEFLQVLCEAGLPAGGLLIAFGFTLVRRRPRRGDPTFAKISWATLMAFTTAAFVNPIFHMPVLAYWACLCAAWLRPSAVGVQKPPTRWRWNTAIAAIALLILWIGVRDVWAHQQRWDRITRVNPSDANAWRHIALESSALDRSLDAASQAVRWAPNTVYDQELLAQRLEAMLQRETSAASLEHYHLALLLAPTRATDALAIGRLLFKEGGAALALPWFERALALEPHYWEADLWAARCLYARGAPEEAIRRLQRLEARHHAFHDRFSGTASITSGYAERILAYDDAVVQKDLRAMKTPHQ